MIRVFTTFILAASVLAGIWYLEGFYFKIFVLLAIALGLFEYVQLVLRDSVSQAITLVLGFAMAAAMIWRPSLELLLGGLISVIFIASLWGLKKREPLPGIVAEMGLMVFGVCYLSLTLPAWSWIRDLGKEWVMLLLFPACLTDTFSFLVGKSIGRRKLAPVVSPNKTWEGFFGGLFGGVFGLWLAARLFFAGWDIAWPLLIGVGMGISIAAIFGDLIESLIKRSAGVKDSSHLIPGHGGVLDRLDALIFTAPLFYFLLKLTGNVQ